MMKKRMAIIVIPTLLFTGVIAALLYSQFSGRLPAEAQHVLDSYLAATPGEVGVKSVSYVQEAEQFTAELGRPILHAPIEEYRTSPILYDGDIIRPPEEQSQFPIPAQELWCVTLEMSSNSAEFYFLARHENLYGSTWVLYEAQSGQSAGCTR